MRATPRRVVVVAAAALAASFFIEPAWAQHAEAFLRDVESGRVDALSNADVVEEREMCLRAGMYVLAFARGPHSHLGYALVDRGDPKEATALIILEPSHQDGQAWDTFAVNATTCFQLAVVHGSARVYELRVAVTW